MRFCCRTLICACWEVLSVLMMLFTSHARACFMEKLSALVMVQLCSRMLRI